MDLSHLDGRSSLEPSAVAALPSEWDWRTQGMVSPVKNQLDCGSCYSFAAIGNIESKLLIDSAGLYDLSENHAKECNWRERSGYEDPPGQSWGSCDGGNYYMLAGLFSRAGLMREQDDLYVPSDVGCSCTSGCPHVKTLLDWRIVSANAIADTAALKQAIYDHGPVYTMMDVKESEGFDSSYDGSYTFDYAAPSGFTDHCVLIVGWSDNLPPLEGGAEPAEGWIVKNSWGSGWGASGYFYATYGTANLGIYTSYIYAWQDYDPSGNVWYYDEDGWTNRYGYNHTTAWGLARFMPDANTHVTRVEFWTTDVTTDVDVYLYDDFDGSTLTNKLAQVLNRSFPAAGYHSVPLDVPVPVSSGDDVYAVIAVTNQSDGYPIAVDANGPVQTGTTYLSHYGTSWSDLGVTHGVDAAIRLRTRIIAPTAPTVSGITPSSAANTGIVHITDLTGSNFQPGVTVALTKSNQSPIVGTSVSRISSSLVTCDFDLTGAATGPWNVVVTNPDAQRAILLNGFSVTAPGGEEHQVYLPLVLRRHPPLPGVPYLNPISNPDGGGDYDVTWNLATLADTYTLEEDETAGFWSPSTAYSGSDLSTSVAGKPPGQYYYRVKASNVWGDGSWSNTRQVTVLADMAQLYVANETGGTLCYEVFDTGIGERCFSPGTYYYGSFPAGTYVWYVSSSCGSASNTAYYPAGQSTHRFWCD
jgi:C1A family cysteine protease